MTSSRPTGSSEKWRIVWVSVGAIAVVASLIAVAFFRQSSLSVTELDRASTTRELDAVRERLGDVAPYVEIDESSSADGGLVHVRPETAPAVPARISRLHVWFCSGDQGRLVRATTPYWAFRISRWKGRAAGSLGALLGVEGLRVELPDLTPHGPGLIADHVRPNGDRLLIWAE